MEQNTLLTFFNNVLGQSWELSWKPFAACLDNTMGPPIGDRSEGITLDIWEYIGGLTLDIWGYIGNVTMDIWEYMEKYRNYG